MPDFYLLPISIENGEEQNTLMPGLFYAVPPKRTARLRAQDRLLLWLRLVGSAPLPPHATEDLLNRAAQVYYKSDGSTTAALRAVADMLNQFLLDRNLRNTRVGRQSIGLLAVGALRGSTIFMALGGPVHTFLLSKAIEHWHDPQLAGRGLGLGKGVALRFFQAELSTGDYLLISPEPSPLWTETNLAGSHGMPIDQFRRRLLQQQPLDLAALVLQVREGSGRFVLLTPRAPAAARPAAPAQTPDAELPPEPAPQAEAIPVVVAEEPSSTTINEEPPAESQVEPPVPEVELLHPQIPAELAPAIEEPAPAPPRARAEAAAVPSQKPPARPARQTVTRRQEAALKPKPQGTPRPPARQGGTLKGLHSLFVRWQAFRARVGQSLQKVFGKLLPGEAGIAPTLTGGQKIFIALAVPIVIVTMASVVYFQRGRDKQFEIYYVQAQAAASQTVGVEDLSVLRAAWGQTLTYLDKADTYKTTPESEALRRQALKFLDDVDSVKRLDFQLAIVGGLADSVNITQMATLLDDLYLFDASRGRIFRASLAGRGYEIDPNFICGPGQYGGTIVTPLVTMAAAPLGSDPGISVIALDSNGVLLYCSAASPPLVRPLAPPDSGWGTIKAMTATANSLYVLDPTTNSVWIYSRNSLTDLPHSFFGSDNPPDLKDAISIALNQNDLFVVFADGRLTTCTRDPLGVAGTMCKEAPYTDSRPGRGTTTPTMPGVTFNHIIYTSLPEPSLYLFAPTTQTIYHFSYKLNLRRLLEPTHSRNSPVPQKTGTAFTINMTNTIYLAVGNQVFMAQAPP